MANFSAFVMPDCYAIGAITSVYGGGDPNGIRTRVTAVKGRCPGPLDDRVAKAGQYRIEFAARKANWQRCLAPTLEVITRMRASAFGKLRGRLNQGRQSTVPYEQ